MSDWTIFYEIKARIKEIEIYLLIGAIIRSKVQDLYTNENSTSYFFSKEKLLYQNLKLLNPLHAKILLIQNLKIFYLVLHCFIKLCIKMNLSTPL